MNSEQIQVGVKAFLRDKTGRYFLAKRNVKKYPDAKGSWDIIGGRMEYKSSLLDNLKREIKEETGLDIISEPILLNAQDIISDSAGHVVRITYSVEVSGDLKLDESELKEYKWMTLDEISQQEDLDIYVKEIISKNILK